MNDTLEADLTRAAGILKLLAPNLDEHAQEAVRAVAEALNAIVDEQRAKQRLNSRAADMAEMFRELYEQAGEPVF
jgi:NAD-dependent oxidoreductase involved in siderophore biosynthesis